MSYAPQIHSGAEGTGVINSVDVNVQNWSGEDMRTNVDITTTGDWNPTDQVVYSRKKTVRRTFTFTLEIFRDGSNEVLSTLPISTNMTNVVLTAFSGHVVTMPLAIINSIAQKTGGTDGVNSWTLTGEAQGTFTIT